MINTAHFESNNVTDCKQAVAEYTMFKTAHFFVGFIFIARYENDCCYAICGGFETRRGLAIFIIPTWLSVD
jgi:hypothetical protein